MKGPSFIAGIAVGLIVAVLVLAATGDAHLVRVPDHPKKTHLENQLASQQENLYHSRYVCRNGAAENRRWHCLAARTWLLREYRQTKARLAPEAWWVAKQIRIAEKLGAAAARDPEVDDPWPNCPDPYDSGGYSWTDTLACENRAYYEKYGNTPDAWRDSPGFFRCGLQFHPMWEEEYGRLCP